MRVNPDTPAWTSPRTGHDWQDPDVLRALAWLSSLVGVRAWQTRLAATEQRFRDAIAEGAGSVRRPLYDAADTIAWYAFQARAYAADRRDWVPEEAARIVPTLVRIGRDLPALLAIPGAEDRAARLLAGDRGQPDGGLFELLVALAYDRAGWRTEFVPERPGRAKTHDLAVSKDRRRWAVECKRMDRSGYDARERARGIALATVPHEMARTAGRSLSIAVVYAEELERLPDDYLARRVSAFLSSGSRGSWTDDGGAGTIRDIDWTLAHSVLGVDDVYFGSSRMIELLTGSYDHDLVHHMEGRWRPSPRRALWAEAVYQASVVSWRSASHEAMRMKARHFRSVVAGAARQLPGDRPGVVHVGIESWSGGTVDALRHLLNGMEMMDFDPAGSRLRWVYGEYVAPEVTTRENETWAVEETSAPYRVGAHRTPEPLPYHLLLGADEGVVGGVHWDPASQRPLRSR